MGHRQFSSVLWEIPFGRSWESACAAMPADINGNHFDGPSRCVNTGGHMWGEFDVPDDSCPHWGNFQRDACSNFGKRQYSSVISDVPPGISWENACASKPAAINGAFFPGAARCINMGAAMWGQFDVDDASCMPRWGNFSAGQCTAPNTRQYSSILWDIPSGVSWENACSQMGASVAGTNFARPSRCINRTTAMWGEFDVTDASCQSHWGAFKQDRCTDSGKRQYSSVLEGIPPGLSWEAACATTPATVQNTSFPRPTRCVNKGVAMWGEFEVEDASCSPVNDMSETALPPGAFEKGGNNGWATCANFCANNGGDWGQRGSCAWGQIASGINAGRRIRCSDLGVDLGATAVQCTCRPLLTGFIDTHTHQFANLGFGGMAIWGRAFGPISEALGHCTPAHGPGGVNDLVFDTLRKQRLFPPTWPPNPSIPPIGHLVGGDAQFDGWPTWDNTSHQGMYEDWLFRAYQGGLRLMVMHAVNNETACSQASKAPGRTCDDAEAIRYQISAETGGAKAFEKYLDDKAGGTGRGWYRIVYTPQEARDTVSANKLAVVLGAEVDFFLNCRTEADCSEGDIRARLQSYKEMGLRHIFPIHFDANGFGGSALSNAITHGPSRFCDQEGYQYQRDPTKAAICGLGLTDKGRFLIAELIRQKMIFDIDHMSYLARSETLTMAEAAAYPVVSGHTGFVDVSQGEQANEGNLKAEEVERVRKLGGMVSVIIAPGDLKTIKTFRGSGTPVVQHQCGATSQEFAQAYLYAVEKMKGGPVGLGTDYNAGPIMPGPRFGPLACPGGATDPQVTPVRYPFAVSVEGSPPALGASVVGQRTFDYNVDGLAHYGLLPDFIADLQAQGIRSKDLDPLFHSAEGYIQLWEKIAQRP